jgi:hypothetical protein
MDSPRACGPPPPEAVYTDLDTAVAAIQGHAKLHGYALCKRDSKAKRVVYTCDRFGRVQSKGKNPNTHATKRRQGSGSKKCGCEMKLVLKLDDGSEQWVVSITYGTHNHESSTAPAAHPAYRTAALDPNAIAQIKLLSSSGVVPAQILSVVRKQFPQAILVQKDVSNIIQKARLEDLAGRTPIQWLLEVCIVVIRCLILLTNY